MFRNWLIFARKSVSQSLPLAAPVCAVACATAAAWLDWPAALVDCAGWVNGASVVAAADAWV